MSIGNTYSNNNQANNNIQEVTVYSNYRMNNAESKIDATCLTFRFWRTNLCIGIFPRKNTGNDEISFDMNNGITIYLSHTKARILKKELELFLLDSKKYNAVGVPSGKAVISISNGAEYGKDTPILTIRGVSETGDITSSFAYEFKSDYHYSIRNYDGKNFDTIYDDYKNIEIEQFITVLNQYIDASVNAMAFSVLDQSKYSNARLDNKIQAIASSLGVDLKNNGRSSTTGKFTNSAYFSNSKSSSDDKPPFDMDTYDVATIDDLE